MKKMQEIQVQPLDWEDSLEKEIATHSSILAWKIPWTEEAGRLQSIGSQRVWHDLATKQQQTIKEAVQYILSKCKNISFLSSALSQMRY